jgi:hypothetical protein
MWIALTGIGTWSAVMIFVALLTATIKERHRMEEAIEDSERRRLGGETHCQPNRSRLANIHTSSRRPNPGNHPVL